MRGSQDHPLITRYPGQTITRYNATGFDQYNLVLGIDKSGAPEPVRPLEGKVTRILYRNPADRSTLEIFRNFEGALKQVGGQLLFTCAGDGCGTPIRWTRVNGIGAMGARSENRYIAAKLTKSGAEAYLSIFIGRYSTQLDVVEIKAMESGLVSVNADELVADIEREGHVAVYGILFDTGKATLKPASAPVLAEIAKVLKYRPGLKLYVVGHTDSTGSLETNMKLSHDRAEAVVQSLVAPHGIAAARLKAHGLGPLAPAATNATEAGKAKNRRVELVAQ
jgi:outer membrane protein OmpA-like peptidoglycan-associated protein